MLVMSEGQGIKRERLFDVVLDPATESGVLLLPVFQSLRKTIAGLGQIPAILQTTQISQVIVIGLARQIVKGVTQEMHIASLPDRLRQNFGNRFP